MHYEIKYESEQSWRVIFWRPQVQYSAVSSAEYRAITVAKFKTRLGAENCLKRFAHQNQLRIYSSCDRITGARDD